MARLGAIDERFQSYNVEMVEVTGGYFWRPYDSKASAPSGGMSAGIDASMYAYRKPIDLSHPRLRKLATALGPAYLRVSGTWANATYFDDAGRDAASPPAGFNGVLTREQWKGVVGFAGAVDAKLVTSFATSQGTRDARGVWTPLQANKLITYTHALGGTIAAAEFMNEPDLTAMSGAPAGYDAASFGRDIAVFRSFLKQVSPQTMFLGPGTISEGGSDGPFTPACAINMRPASRSGSRRPRMHHAAAIPGIRHFWTAFAISISSGAWRSAACRSSCTTRSRQAITVCSMKAISRRGRTIGRRYSGAG